MKVGPRGLSIVYVWKLLTSGKSAVCVIRSVLRSGQARGRCALLGGCVRRG